MSSELCLKFQFDSYEQEIERFGGPEGMTCSEAIFGADSRNCVAMQRYLKAKLWPHDETTLLALSIDDLLKGLGLSEKDLPDWYTKKAMPGGQEVGSDYRKRKNVLRAVIGQQEQFLGSYEHGPALASILDQRRTHLSRAAQTLRELSEAGRLEQPLDDLCGSFVHLHLNRMGGAAAQSEPTILSLLLRTRESLEKAPL